MATQPRLRRRVAVTFDASPSRDVWERIQADMKRQVPLKNLHWRSANRSIRTIQSLDIDFKPLPEAEAPEEPPAASGRRPKPYMNLLIVACDDNEAYRSAVRQDIRAWLDKIQSRGATEWLIVHVTAARTNQGGLFARKSGVLDKIKADFNPPKRERCIQIPYSGPNSAEPADLALWADLSNRLKEGIIGTFDADVAAIEERVRSLDAQRGAPEWNFCSFFAIKEGLADCFETMGLLEDALVQYDELEATFFQVLREHPGTWSGRRGGTTRGDDSHSILDHSEKPYRDWIVTDKITLFDLRIYLFARQCAILAAAGKVCELATRASRFIGLFPRVLDAAKHALAADFVESWVFSACCDVAEQCQSLAKECSADSPDVGGYLRSVAELYETALAQLNKLGIQAGYLPHQHPFSMLLPEKGDGPTPTPSEVDRPPITRRDLVVALGAQDTFDKLYLDITNRAIHANQQSLRRRSALKLHATVAALEQIRSRTAAAQRLFSHLPAHYVEARWTVIESALLDRCAQLQSSLDMSRERLLSTLALVRSGVEYDSTDWRQDVMLSGEGEDMVKLARRLMDDVRNLAGELEKDFAAIAFPTFSVALASESGEAADGEDGSNVVARITNRLPTPVQVDGLRLKFFGPNYDQLWFTTGTQVLQPGTTDVALYCPTPVVGTLALELSQIRISRIIFQYAHRPQPARNLAPDPKHAPMSAKQPKVHFAKDANAMDATLSTPQDIHLDRDRLCIVTLSSGRNRIAKATVALTAGDRVAFRPAGAQLVSGAAETHAADSAVELRHIPARCRVHISIPFVGTPSEAAVSVNVDVEYFTASMPEVKRAIRKTCSLQIALPLAVNVQDFFREECIISRFSVATDGKNPLRIQSATLEAPDSLTITPARPTGAGPTTIQAPQTSTYLFKIATNPSTPVNNDAMRLVLSYRTLGEEVSSVLKHRINVAMKGSPYEESSTLCADLVCQVADAAVDISAYALLGRLDFGVFDAALWNARLRELTGDPDQRAALVEIIRAVVTSSEPLPDFGDAPWRILSIPVELPTMSIFNVVSFLLPTGLRPAVGEPTSVAISLRTSFRWARPTDAESMRADGPELVYDVIADYEDWLVSGKKRGSFKAQDGAEVLVELSLVPLRSGSLFLPTVAIQPLPSAASAATGQAPACETHHANAAERVTVLPIHSTSRYFIPEREDSAVTHYDALLAA